jgi:hypothetical protein
MASLFNRRIEDTYQFLLHIEDSLLQDGLGRPREINMSGSSFINGTFSGDGSGLTGIVTGSSVAGANKSIQFNNGGVLDGASEFYYDPIFDNVGIGTSSPSRDLHVDGDTLITGVLELTGNLGLGTTSPTEKLHVVGNQILTGQLSIGGFADVSASMATFGTVKSVNGTPPDLNGNVATTLTDVQVGLSASRPTTASNGTVYVVAGETDPDKTGSNGESYIYSTDSAEWFKLAPLDQPANDARYLNTAGDTATGRLLLAQGTNPLTDDEAITKGYADQFVSTGSITSNTLTFNKGDGTSFNIDLPAAQFLTTASLFATSSTDATLQFQKADASVFNVVIPGVGGGNASIEVGSTPPAAPTTGSMWLDDTTTGELFVYDGDQWVSVSGISGDDVTLGANTFEGDQTITGSVNISTVLNLAPQATLPTGRLGDLATSGSNLYFFNGTSWNSIS